MSWKGNRPWSHTDLRSNPGSAIFSQWWCCLVAQARPTLCDPMYCSQPGSSVHGVHQARILEWVASPFSRSSHCYFGKIAYLSTAVLYSGADHETFQLLNLFSLLYCVSESKGDFSALKGSILIFFEYLGNKIYCCSVTKLCPTLCDPVDCSIPGFPVLHCLLEYAQIHVRWVCGSI